MHFVAIYLLFTCFVSCHPPVTTCPAGCYCDTIGVKCDSLTGTKLQAIPPDIPPSTVRLFIRNQNIARIRREDFRNLGSLQHLEVTDSNVQIVDDDAFQFLTELRILHLSTNAISTVNRNTLGGLNKLFSLGLDDNPDLKIDPCSLSSLNSLTELYLRNTSVTFNLSLWENCEDQSISPAVYGIRRLNIGGEDADIAGDLLVNLTELITLSILEPPADLLMRYNISSLESLPLLTMAGLTFFPSDFLVSENVTNLVITESSLTHLPAYAFTNVSSLASCDIMNSNLMYVHKDAFRGLTRLTYLGLYNNKLQTLPVGLLTDISPPGYLNLALNPWNCNCSLYWLFGEETEQITVLSGECASPPASAGVPLTRVDELASCEPPMTSPELTPTPHATSRTIGHPSQSEGASPQSNPPTKRIARSDTTTAPSKPTELATNRTLGHPSPSEGASPQSNQPTELIITSKETTTAPLELSVLPGEDDNSLLDNWYYLALVVTVVLIILLVITVVVCWMRPAGTRKNNRGIDDGAPAPDPPRDLPGIQMRGVGQSSRNIADPDNSGADYYYEVGNPGGGDGRRADDQIVEDSFEDSGEAASEPIVHEYPGDISSQAPGYERRIHQRRSSVHLYERNIEEDITYVDVEG